MDPSGSKKNAIQIVLKHLSNIKSFGFNLRKLRQHLISEGLFLFSLNNIQFSVTVCQATHA